MQRSKEHENSLYERAAQLMTELERKYVFLRTDSHLSKRDDKMKQDSAAMEALTELRERLSA